MAYYVFMIDLKDSKKLTDDARRESQARLKEAKNAVNEFLAGKARAEFSSGDSLQGFTQDAALALRVCLLIVFLMQPNELHCGIGMGDIYVLDDEGTNASDGPAYHDARAALERSKKESREVVARFGLDADGLIGALLESAQFLRDANTPRQNRFVALACLEGLSGGDAGIAELGLRNTGFRGAAFPEPGTRLDERQSLAQFISTATDTSMQNGYDMVRKSKALFIAQAYRTCLDYLTTAQGVK